MPQRLSTHQHVAACFVRSDVLENLHYEYQSTFALTVAYSIYDKSPPDNATEIIQAFVDGAYAANVTVSAALIHLRLFIIIRPRQVSDPVE